MYRFPVSEGLVSAPLTVVDVVRADDDVIEIKTCHSYAEDLAFVFTQTTVTVESE